jgi:hypothetical protein
MIIPALTGASFACWCVFDFPAALHLLNDPLAVSPNNGCGNPFRGSSRLLKGYIPCRRGSRSRSSDRPRARKSRCALYRRRRLHVWECARPAACVRRSILRVSRWSEHATCSRHFASAYLALGNQLAAAAKFRTHIELVTTQVVQAAPFTAGATLTLPLVLGRSCKIPVHDSPDHVRRTKSGVNLLVTTSTRW